MFVFTYICGENEVSEQKIVLLVESFQKYNKNDINYSYYHVCCDCSRFDGIDDVYDR